MCDKPGNGGFAFMRSYQKNSGSEKDETRKDETAGVTTLRNAVILLQLFFFLFCCAGVEMILLGVFRSLSVTVGTCLSIV